MHGRTKEKETLQLRKGTEIVLEQWLPDGNLDFPVSMVKEQLRKKISAPWCS